MLVNLIQKADKLARDAVIQVEDWALPKEAKLVAEADENGRKTYSLLVADVAKVETVVKADVKKVEAAVKTVEANVVTMVPHVVTMVPPVANVVAAVVNTDVKAVANTIAENAEVLEQEVVHEVETLANKVANIFHPKSK